MQLLPSEQILFAQFFSLGFFGGFAHCMAMCGPFVLTQSSNLLQNLEVSKFSGFKKLQILSLIPYHLGRATTYCVIAFCCSFLSSNIKEFSGFKNFSAIFLLIAAAIFLLSFFGVNFSSKSNFLPKKLLQKFFKNPRGINGYFLGILLGFLPCGLLYGAFALAAAIDNPLNAAMAMLLFSLGTFFGLFLVSFGGLFFHKIDSKIFFKFSRFVIFLNVILLVVMAFGEFF